MTSLRALLAAITSLGGLLSALPVIILGVPFWVVAFLTRVFVRVLEPRVVSWWQVIEFFPVIGWKPKPNLRTHGLADDVFLLSTDSHGWRGMASIAESHIVVFGDSFAFGQGVNDTAFFPELDRKLRIKAIGAPGYNMVQELLWMERLAPQLAAKLVVWFIYFGNELYENLVPDMCNYRMPFLRAINGAGDWEIVTSHVSPAKWFYPAELRADRTDYYAKLAQICSPTFLSDRAYSACEYLLRRGRDICRQVGAELAVMTIPETTQLSRDGLRYLLSRGGDPKSFDPDFPDRKIGDICRTLGVPFIPGKSHLDVSHYKIYDPHWNERGHQRVSEVLSAFYRDFVLEGHRFQAGIESSGPSHIRPDNG